MVRRNSVGSAQASAREFGGDGVPPSTPPARGGGRKGVNRGANRRCCRAVAPFKRAVRLLIAKRSLFILPPKYPVASLIVASSGFVPDAAGRCGTWRSPEEIIVRVEEQGKACGTN